MSVHYLLIILVDKAARPACQQSPDDVAVPKLKPAESHE